jgi:hypothetical protein
LLGWLPKERRKRTGRVEKECGPMMYTECRQRCLETPSGCSHKSSGYRRGRGLGLFPAPTGRPKEVNLFKHVDPFTG